MKNRRHTPVRITRKLRGADRLLAEGKTISEVCRTVYTTKAQARRDVIAYIEAFYNNSRRRSALGYKRPNDVHCSYQQPLAAA